MTTENINIIIREDGSRQVTQNLNQIATSGDGASRVMNVLKIALEAVAAALAIEKLKEYADTWASVTGIVEVATKTHQEATAVLDKLFDAAQNVRTPIEDIAQLYGRAARAATDLGASQEQAIQFTKEVGQALVVQHVSATQASGALLQLGQLLGTGKVRAQEFNSVNENLSVVLQVVARNITAAGGSINTLKQLVEKGTVGSKEFFEAFLKGSAGLQRDFDKSAFTIAQGLTLISNSLIKMVGDLNEATGASQVFGEGAKFVADHMKDIEAAIVALTKLLATGAAAWLTYSAAQATAAGVARVQEFLAFTDAVAKGTVVILGSAEAQRQKALATVEALGADIRAAAAADAAAVAEARGAVLVAEATTAEIVAKQGLIDVTRASAAANLAQAATDAAVALRAVEAARAAGAQSFALATLRDATAELVAAEGVRSIAMTEFAAVRQVEIVNEEALTAALGRQAAAQATLTEATVAGNTAMTASAQRLAVAQGELAAATAAAAGTTGRLAQLWAVLRGAIAPVIGAIGELFALINANPITALVTALVIAGGLLLGFGDKVNAGIDSITTLGNVTDVVKQRISSAFKTLGTELSDFWKNFTDDGKSALGQTATAAATVASGYAASFQQAFATTTTGWARWLTITARIFDELTGIVLGVGGIIVNTFRYVWVNIAQGGKIFIADTLRDFQDLINLIIDGLNKVQGKKIEHLDILPKVDPHALDDIGQTYGEAVTNGFAKGVALEGGIAEKSLQNLFSDAQADALGKREAQKFAEAAAHAVDLTTHGKPNKPPIDPKEFDAARNALEQLLNKVDPAQGAVLALAKAEDVLNRALKDGVINRVQYNRYLRDTIEYFQQQADPLAREIAQINQQTNLLGLQVQQREVEAEVEQKIDALKQSGLRVGAAEIDQLRASIEARNNRNRVMAEEDAMISATVLTRQKYVNQLVALQELLSRPATLGAGFSEGDRAQELLKIDPEVLSTTKIAIDAVRAQYDSLYDHINELRAKNVIDDTTATRLQGQNAVRLQQQVTQSVISAANARLKLADGSWADAQISALSKLTEDFTTFTAGATDAFGNFFESFSQGFADSVGKAVVESENLNDALHNVAQQAVEGLISALVKLGIQWLANYAIQTLGITTTTTASAAAAAELSAAYATPATLASIASYGGAAAIGEAAVLAALAATSVAAAGSGAGFASGGYTGDGPVNEVAGVVHGKEYVMNATATAKHRDLLEALNSGRDVTVPSSTNTKGSAGNVQVKIENYGTSKTYDVQHLTANEVRIIARDEVTKGAPGAVAASMSDPNSPVSKSVSRNTTAKRNHR